MEIRSSIDGIRDDDSHHLIGQKNTRSISSTGRRGRSASDIEDLDSRIGTARHFVFRFNKSYFLAILISVLFFVAFFSADIRGSSSGHASAFRLGSIADRMRESELRALSLLKQQRLGPFGLWNHAFLDFVIARNGTANFTLSSSNSSVLKRRDSGHLLVSSSALFENFKSAVLRLIKLNKDIEEVLLSPHQSGNLSV